PGLDVQVVEDREQSVVAQELEPRYRVADDGFVELSHQNQVVGVGERGLQSIFGRSRTSLAAGPQLATPGGAELVDRRGRELDEAGQVIDGGVAGRFVHRFSWPGVGRSG